MNDWMWARSAATRSAARTCCMACSVRMRTNSSKPPGVTVMRPRSRKAIACTARSSSTRSCETSSTAPGKRASQVSSHSVASRSRWLVGSSSSSRSGAANSAVARATRMRQPPENSSTGRACAASSKPRPARMAAARAGAASAPIARRRSWISASRMGGAVSASVSRARRSGSPCSTVSSSDGVARGGLLGDGGDAGAGGEADVSAVQRHFAGDGAQQGGLAGAVAADQADAAALVHREVGTVQDGASAKADGGAGDDEDGHGGG